MSDSLSKIPFLRLLLPAVAAIIVSAYVVEIAFSLLLCLAGTFIITISYFIGENKQFSYRWLYGLGLFIVIFGLFSFLFQLKNKQSAFTFGNEQKVYIATISDLPQEKPKSIACNVNISYPLNKKIVVYFQKDENARNLRPGDEVIFKATVQPFKNMGNPDDFNYRKFMHNKGFAGTTYLSSNSWQTTGKSKHNPQLLALNLRLKILNFYRLFELDNDAFSFISALTLGHKHELSDDLKEAFRASGTSHVLAVSGLHVGIIYAVFSFLFSFFRKRGKSLIIRQTLIIIALWFYALLTGFSPSVNRAVIMLTIVSYGIAQSKKGFTYNTLAATAFFLLAYNPNYLFDVGFQMSFGAVLAILFFNPLINKVFKPRTKFTKYVWDLLTVSTSAQLGVFPITLFYFGTFPTYFFVANLLIVPVIAFIIYACIPLIAIVMLQQTGLLVFDYFFSFFQWILKLFIGFVLKVVYFIETIPYSQLSGYYISATQMILLLAMIVFSFLFWNRKRVSYLLSVLSCTLFFTSSFAISNMAPKPDRFAVFNTPGIRDIGFFINDKRFYIEYKKNTFIPHPEKRILLLSENLFTMIKSERKLSIDILILSEDGSFAVSQLNDLLDLKQIVLDSSLTQSTKNKWKKEFHKLDIPVHDVSLDGAFLINL